MDDNRALSPVPKTWNRKYIVIGRGALPRRRSIQITEYGASGKANVGISNDKGGEKPPRRKTKVS